MKIAYLLGSLNRGGMETLLLDVFKNASKADFKFIGIHRKDGVLKNDFYATGQQLFRLSPKCPFDLLYFRNLRKLLKKEQIAIVHAQQYLDAFYAWFACLGTDIKVVLTLHGYDSTELNKKSRLLSFTAKRTQKNIFVSHSQQNFYVNKYKLKHNKLSVVYNGISFDKLDRKYEVPDFLQKNSSPARLKMAMVGNFVRVREQGLVCRFLKLLRDKDVAFDFYFVGAKDNTEPWRYDDCVRYCNENGLNDYVHFLGSRSDVPTILKQLDAFIYSTDHDTFGIAVIEAIASEVPVFVNDREVMLEVTNQGEWATIYKTQNELDLLEKFMSFLQHKEEYRQKAIEASVEVRNKFSIEKHLQNLKKEYYSTIC